MSSPKAPLPNELDPLPSSPEPIQEGGTPYLNITEFGTLIQEVADLEQDARAERRSLKESRIGSLIDAHLIERAKKLALTFCQNTIFHPDRDYTASPEVIAAAMVHISEFLVSLEVAAGNSVEAERAELSYIEKLKELKQQSNEWMRRSESQRTGINPKEILSFHRAVRSDLYQLAITTGARSSNLLVWKIHKVLGTGGQSRVLLAEDPITGELLALKVYDIEGTAALVSNSEERNNLIHKTIRRWRTEIGLLIGITKRGANEYMHCFGGWKIHDGMSLMILYGNPALRHSLHNFLSSPNLRCTELECVRGSDLHDVMDKLDEGYIIVAKDYSSSKRNLILWSCAAYRGRGARFLNLFDPVAEDNKRELTQAAFMLREKCIASIILDAARALKKAHKLGIIHRDVKTSNIMLVQEESTDHLSPRKRGDVIVGDMGMATKIERRTSALYSQALGMDEEGNIPSPSSGIYGTLEFMAPEQSRGARTEKGDVYGLGATLFAMLSQGVPVNDGATHEERVQNLRTGNIHTDLKPVCHPDAVAARNKNCPIPSNEICKIVHQSIERNPNERYSMLELITALEKFLKS